MTRSPSAGTAPPARSAPADLADYEHVLAASRQRSIFAEPWWLDTVIGRPGGWEPNVVRDKDGAPVAAWPLPARTTRAGRVGHGIPYTPWLGPLLRDAATPAARASSDVQLLEQLAAGPLADWAHVEAACMPELDYWTPLAWHGYTQTTRTTWRIAGDQTPELVRAGMRTRGRRALSIAARDGLTCQSGTVADLLDACEATFGRQGSDTPARHVLDRVATESLARERGEILTVRTADGQLASAGLYVWDDRFTYSLANGRIDAVGSFGSHALLMSEAIRTALARGTAFDFEGSMLQPVEHFVRGFGGAPHSYSVVRRSSPAWERSVARRRLAKRLLRR